MEEKQPKSNREFTVDRLRVMVAPDRTRCGQVAATHVATEMRRVLAKQPHVSIAFGAAPSQNEFFAVLAKSDGVDWTRVIAFQLDEYLGVGADDPRRLRNYMQRHFYRFNSPGQIFSLAADTAHPGEECRRYAKLLQQYPLDIACLGIGESGHLAYNDPHVARFDDPEMVKLIEIDEVSRLQQVHDGTVSDFQSAICKAYTLTLPTLMRAPCVSCVAPGKIKAAAVAKTLSEPVSERWPATILRKHPNAVLFLDADSATQVKEIGGSFQRETSSVNR